MEFQTLIELVAKEYGLEPIIMERIMQHARNAKVKSNGTYFTKNHVVVDISINPDDNYEGFHMLILFENDYGVSVVWHYGTYGYEDDKLELAVVKHNSYGSYSLCYDSPTDICQGDVEGWLTAKEAFNMIQKIERIEEN